MGSIDKDIKEPPVHRCLESREQESSWVVLEKEASSAKPRSLDLILDQRHSQRSFLWRDEGQQIGS